MLDLFTALCVGIACAALSVFVVLRRWAFIGEGISHGGLGGAGTAWLLALAFPFFDQLPVVYGAVAIFCIMMGAGIAYFTRSGQLSSDTVIGIFLVASVAWGFLAQQIYAAANDGRAPAEFDTLLFGQMHPVSPLFALIALVVCLAVVGCVAALGKEIIAYAFDPMLAEVSGVRVGPVHYLLIVLLTLTIIIGAPVLGSLLVIALLVLPGATALLLSRHLRTVHALAFIASLLSVLGGLLAHRLYGALPVGPCISLILFVEFLLAWVFARATRRSAAA